MHPNSQTIRPVYCIHSLATYPRFLRSNLINTLHTFFCEMTRNDEHTLQSSWGVSQRQREIQQARLKWLALHVFQVLAGLQSAWSQTAGQGMSYRNKWVISDFHHHGQARNSNISTAFNRFGMTKTQKETAPYSIHSINQGWTVSWNLMFIIFVSKPHKSLFLFWKVLLYVDIRLWLSLAKITG